MGCVLCLLLSCSVADNLVDIKTQKPPRAVQDRDGGDACGNAGSARLDASCVAPPPVPHARIAIGPKPIVIVDAGTGTCDGSCMRGCDGPCSLASAQSACVNGACVVLSCQDGHADRDHDPANGCECAIAPEQCNNADDDCDGELDETFALATDPQNCGACGKACHATHARTACVARRCELVGCEDGYLDADGDRRNGCECAKNAPCANGPSPPPAPCSGSCTLANAQSACVKGACAVISCQDGYADLDHDAANGCECVIAPEQCNNADDDCDGELDESFDLANDPQNCGICGNICSAAHASMACVARRCELVGCDDGYLDADGDHGNGCECATSAPCANNTPPPCNGSCSLANAQSACVDSACVVTSCQDGYADRDHHPANGCECAIAPELCNNADDDCDGELDETFDLANDPQNCGICANACASDRVCSGGSCKLICSGGTTACGDQCADTQVDPAHCGRCDDACVAGESCLQGVCTADCAPPSTSCNGRCVDLSDDPSNCGACGTACELANATAACSSAHCEVVACSPGFVDLNGSPGDGCECQRQAELCDGKDNDCDGLVDGSIVDGVPSSACTCEVLDQIELNEAQHYPNSDPLPPGYCASIGCQPDSTGLVFSYCLDNAQQNDPWAVCIGTSHAMLNAFDVDFGNEGVLQVVFDVLSPASGSLNLYYGVDPRRKYVRLIEPGETKQPRRYVMNFAPAQAYFPRWQPVPQACQGQNADRCGTCRQILSDPQFQFDDVPLFLAAENFPVHIEGQVRLISVERVSAGCACLSDADCGALTGHEQCLPAASLSSEPGCGWPSDRRSGMCGPAQSCDSSYVGRPCTVQTANRTCSSTLTCEQGQLVCSASDCAQ
jgi:hypothetical protein